MRWPAVGLVAVVGSQMKDPLAYPEEVTFSVTIRQDNFYKQAAVLQRIDALLPEIARDVERRVYDFWVNASQPEHRPLIWIARTTFTIGEPR